MSSPDRYQSAVNLAITLGLSTEGDCLVSIREYALAKVNTILNDFHASVNDFLVDNFDDLRRLVSNKLFLKIEWIQTNGDIERVANDYQDFHSSLRQRLHHEFLQSKTEGITLTREQIIPGMFRFLAVIDARGEQASRAYFTTWHEIAHLLLQAEEDEHSSCCLAENQKRLPVDDIEWIVDHVTEHLAFYSPFFEPVLRSAIEVHGRLTFHAIDEARNAVVPKASLLATTKRSIEHIDKPTLLMEIYAGLNKAEQRALEQAIPNPPSPKLRVRYINLNDIGRKGTFAIRKNMRVPPASVLARAYESNADECYEAAEDQSWWETSKTGSLPSLPLWVDAVRRGRFVYGIITVR